MKKILCFITFVLLLVSCSKDSGEEDGLTSNYIEVAGVRHQIDKFVIENESEFYIGSKKDGTYISFGYTWYIVPIGEKIYFVETDEYLEYFELVDNYRKCKLTDGSSDSFYLIKKNSDNYIVDIYIGSSKYKTVVHYEGKMI